MKDLNVHLVSQFTMETLSAVGKSALSQFSNIKPKFYFWPLITDVTQLEICLKKIEHKPGLVLYILMNYDLRDRLKEYCLKKRMPCIGVLGKVIKEISNYLDVTTNNYKKNDEFLNNKDYFDRAEALDFALRHDDGQKFSDIDEADIVIVGPSRTLKTPTAVYLAFYGIKAANVPYIKGYSNDWDKIESPLIIGMCIDHNRLAQIRANRLKNFSYKLSTDYTDLNSINEECIEFKKLASKKSWPMIDATFKSVEEIAAEIIKLFFEKKGKC